MKAGHVAPDPLHLLQAAFAAGLEQGAMLKAACAHYGEADAEMREDADRHVLLSGDKIQLDDHALISEGEDGTWVAAWLLV